MGMRGCCAAGVAAVVSCCLFGAASAGAVTPGWECVPTTAGQPVLSGGTGAAPACSGRGTAVLAPTYIAAGPGGKPAVQFSAVNVQIISGAGTTNATPNGKGNLIIGYDEGTATKTGSHNLILGQNQAYTSYASIIAGSNNTTGSPYDVVFGYQNKTNASYATVTGGRANTARGNYATVSGGFDNTTAADYASVAGGCGNLAGNVILPPCRASVTPPMTFRRSPAAKATRPSPTTPPSPAGS